MSTIVKAILFIVPGCFGLFYNPFKRKGFDRIRVDNCHFVSILPRDGFNRKSVKRDAKKLYKLLKPYSKGMPKYLTKMGIIDDDMPPGWRHCKHIGYMSSSEFVSSVTNLLGEHVPFMPSFTCIIVNHKLDNLTENFGESYPSLDLMQFRDFIFEINTRLERAFLANSDKFNKEFIELVGDLFCDECEADLLGGIDEDGECEACGRKYLDKKGLKALEKMKLAAIKDAA